MPVFRVEKPVEIPLHARGGVDIEKVTELCRNPSDALMRYGCYIFAAQRRRVDGWVPIYAGKAAEQTLGNEALSPDKLKKVDCYLQQHGARPIMLFLITHPIQRGHQNARAIAHIERWLIGLAHEVNPELINKQLTSPEGWGIGGVIRGGRGKRSDSAAKLRELLGLGDDVPAPPADEAPADLSSDHELAQLTPATPDAESLPSAEDPVGDRR